MTKYSKSQIKSMLSFLKKVGNARPILKNACIQKGKMVFTDSYVGFWLNEDVPELPHVEDRGYPDMIRLFNSFSEESDRGERIKIDIVKLKQAIKDKEKAVLVDGLPFSPVNIKTICSVMNNDSFLISKKLNYATLFVNNEFGFAVTLGMRSYDDDHSKFYEVSIKEE